MVLFGSFFGICAILGTRVVLRNRNVRKFVRGVKQRTEHAEQRGFMVRETPVVRPQRNPRASAVEMQQVRSLLREAEKTAARRQYDETEKILIQALTVKPNFLDARAQLAKLYLLTDRDAKAEALYRELLLDANDISFHANLGLACYKQEKYEEACAAYLSALDLDPKSPERAAALGRACIAAHRLTEAAELLERATERLARDTELLRMLAECYEHMGNPRAAEETYRKIHRLQPYDEQVKEKLSMLALV